MVSIIVPVYNVEKYLDDCIQSVLCQTYTDWELLLINDGSTDQSTNICNRYVALDDRILLVHESNSGVSVARNVALSVARGDYIIFLDADDYWCKKTALNELVTTAEKFNVDIVRGEYKRIEESGCEIHGRQKTLRCENNNVIDSVHFLRYVVRDDFFCFLLLFRAEVLKNIRFEKDRVFMEDMVFLAKVCMRPLRCIYVPNLIFYAYRENYLGASKKTNILKLRDCLYNGMLFLELYEQTDNVELKKYFQYMCLNMYRNTLMWLAPDKYYRDCVQFISDYKVEFCRKEILIWAKKNAIRVNIIPTYIPSLLMIRLYRIRYKLSKLKHLLTWN